jgi:transcriptional regulator with XRE-family HTH domain
MHGMHAEALPPNRLRELLAQRGLKLVDVAALCRVDQSTAWRWQDGVIPQKYLPAVAGLLGVSVPYLAGWTDEDNGAPAAEAVA